MKRFAILTILLVFLLGIPLSTLAKGGKEESGSAAQFCTANNNLGYNSSGQCISVFRTMYGPGNSGPVAVCKELLNNAPETFYGNYNSVDDCVSHLRNGYIAE